MLFNAVAGFDGTRAMRTDGKPVEPPTQPGVILRGWEGASRRRPIPWPMQHLMASGLSLLPCNP